MVKKIISLTSIFLLASSLILAQNLVELAKKEKERRAKIKAKKSIVITNSDLTRIRKRLAAVMPEAVATREPARKAKAPMKNIRPVKTRFQGQEETDKMDYPISALELKNKLQQTREYIQLLRLKINALWQEFYSLDDTISKENIQKSIDQTNRRLKAVKEEERRIQRQLSQLKSQK